MLGCVGRTLHVLAGSCCPAQLREQSLAEDLDLQADEDRVQAQLEAQIERAQANAGRPACGTMVTEDWNLSARCLRWITSMATATATMCSSSDCIRGAKQGSLQLELYTPERLASIRWCDIICLHMPSCSTMIHASRTFGRYLTPCSSSILQETKRNRPRHLRSWCEGRKISLSACLCVAGLRSLLLHRLSPGPRLGTLLQTMTGVGPAGLCLVAWPVTHMAHTASQICIDNGLAHWLVQTMHTCCCSCPDTFETLSRPVGLREDTMNQIDTECSDTLGSCMSTATLTVASNR